MKKTTWTAIALGTCLLLYAAAYLIVTSGRRNPGYAFVPGHGSGKNIVTVEFHGDMVPSDNTLYTLFWPLGQVERLLTGHDYENDVNHETQYEIENPEP